MSDLTIALAWPAADRDTLYGRLAALGDDLLVPLERLCHIWERLVEPAVRRLPGPPRGDTSGRPAD
jgi:hypothetical protein